jgi:hypothetical protein
VATSWRGLVERGVLSGYFQRTTGEASDTLARQLKSPAGRQMIGHFMIELAAGVAQKQEKSLGRDTQIFADRHSYHQGVEKSVFGRIFLRRNKI